MSAITRRQAMFSSLAAPLAVSNRVADDAAAPSHIKLSIAAYSFRKYLEIKKPAGQEMTLFQFADLCSEWGLGSIEVTSYYIPETTPAWLQRFKRHLTSLGLDVSGTAVGNDFCLADDAKRAAEVAKVKTWIEISSYLGAKTIRVFAGYVPKGDTEEAARKRCIECLKEVVDFAPKHGVVVAVENHGGITAKPEQVLALVEGVKHEWFGVNLDTFNFRTPDPYGDLTKVAPHAVTVQMKTEVQVAGQKKQPADFGRLFGILRDAKYHGYVALEYEAEEEPKTAVPRHLGVLKKLVG
jgi:sugar phosphate isomerase/epimerase